MDLSTLYLPSVVPRGILAAAFAELMAGLGGLAPSDVEKAKEAITVLSSIISPQSGPSTSSAGDQDVEGKKSTKGQQLNVVCHIVYDQFFVRSCTSC